MWEETKLELDTLLQRGSKMRPERRRHPRLREFEAHLEFLARFNEVQDQVIRPAMSNFGRYLETLGHQHFIESADELLDGHQLPVSRITLHILRNNGAEARAVLPRSLTFRIDSTKKVCLYNKSSYCSTRNGLPTTFCHCVGRYGLDAVTPELVESFLKAFVIEALTS